MLEEALSVVMIGLRLSPLRLFFWPLPLAANAAVVATFLAWFVTAFLISAPFIIARAAAWAARGGLEATGTSPNCDRGWGGMVEVEEKPADLQRATRTVRSEGSVNWATGMRR